ncbi:AI-2E family transporter [Limobrevibacterium gyesilva]|nr:AI-2E family transporter [Limobrevibacterium gyesilva]
MRAADGHGGPNDLGTLTSLAIGVVIVVALYVGRDVLVPIALAILLSFVLAPVVRLLRRAWLGRVPAVFLAVTLALGVILSLGGLIGMQMSQLIPDIPRYASTIDQKIASVRTRVVGQMSGIVDVLGKQLQRASAPSAQPPPGPAAGPGEEAGKPMPVEIRQPEPTPIEIAERILAPLVPPLATAGIVFIVTIFILLQQADLRDRFIRLFGLQDLHRTTRALDDTTRRLSRYLLTQLGLNAFFGLLIGVGLLLIGVPNPLLWGTLAALFRFVPYIGSVLSGLLPTALAAAIDPGWSMAIYTAALFVVTETVMGQFVDPLAYGRSTGLSPVSVVIAAIFWTWMWGPIGLILSMPLTVCLVVLGRHVQRLEFLDVLMGDRPALTPAESFYQRILANDPDEALEYAEFLLKDRSLSTYYDEVAIKGLQLAANDAERGVLSVALLARIQGAMSRLIEELDGFSDVAPASAKPRSEATSGVDMPAQEAPPSPAASERIEPEEGKLVGAWSGPAPVLCIAGSGALDGAVTDMLVQLLAKNGLGARAVPFAAASREAIGSLDATGVAMVCICYLDISFSPSQLRYLVRRVRQIAPRTPVLVGLWPREDAQASEERLQAAVDADYYVSSLREGVNACLALARAARQVNLPGCVVRAA